MKWVAVHSRSRTDQPDATASCRASVRESFGPNAAGMPARQGRMEAGVRQPALDQRPEPAPLGRHAAAGIEGLLPAGEAVGQQVQQGRARPDLEGADLGGRAVGGFGGQIGQPGGAAEVQQHAAAIATPQQQPLGQCVRAARPVRLGPDRGRERRPGRSGRSARRPWRRRTSPDIRQLRHWRRPRIPDRGARRPGCGRGSARVGQQVGRPGRLGFPPVGPGPWPAVRPGRKRRPGPGGAGRRFPWGFRRWRRLPRSARASRPRPATRTTAAATRAACDESNTPTNQRRLSPRRELSNGRTETGGITPPCGPRPRGR